MYSEREIVLKIMGDLSPEKGDLSLFFIEEKLLLEVGFDSGS